MGVSTFRYGPPPLPRTEAARAVEIVLAAAAWHLGGAVCYQTISSDASSPAADDAFAGLHQFLADSFPRVRAGLRRERVNQFSLLYTWTGRDPSLQPILLTAHLDVVPVEDGTEGDWTHPPFAGRVADGFIWGRGTLDVKQSVLAMLETAEFLLGEGFRPDRTIYFAFGHDEEIGGKRGAGEITRRLRGLGQSMAFSLDEGLAITQGIIPGLAKPAALIGIGEKGYASFELTSRGPGGHSSRPLRPTVIGRLGRALDRLETNPMPARLQGPGADLFRYLAPHFSFA
ncbi:MAG: M20/M25/M40 family metallo-hydrolase [Rhodospirillales bacterium]|nr:M20/M25/M40 family metallo-hydrolase [Rhodospirillales bacterium]